MCSAGSGMRRVVDSAERKVACDVREADSVDSRCSDTGRRGGESDKQAALSLVAEAGVGVGVRDPLPLTRGVSGGEASGVPGGKRGERSVEELVRSANGGERLPAGGEFPPAP